MNFEAHGTMRSNPGVALTNRVSPLQCSAKIQGQGTAEIGAIAVHLAQIPVRLRIPFLRRSTPILVGSVGPAEFKVDPFTCSLKEFSIGCDAHLGGKEGFLVTTEGKVACATELSLDGTATGDIGLGSIHFGQPSEGGRTQRQHRRRSAE